MPWPASSATARSASSAAVSETMPDPAVEGLLEVLARHPAGLGDQPEHRRQRPGGPVEVDGQLDRQDPLEVGGQPAAGDVRHRVGLGLAGEVQAGLGVDPGRLEQLLAERAAEVVHVLVEAALALLRESTCRTRE